MRAAVSQETWKEDSREQKRSLCFYWRFRARHTYISECHRNRAAMFPAQIFVEERNWDCPKSTTSLMTPEAIQPFCGQDTLRKQK